MQKEHLLKIVERLKTMDQRLWNPTYFTIGRIDSGVVGCIIARLPELFPDDWYYTTGIIFTHVERFGCDGATEPQTAEFFGLTYEQNHKIFDFRGRPRRTIQNAIDDIMSVVNESLVESVEVQ